MKSWIYVLCYNAGRNGRDGEDWEPAFVHTRVEAENEDDAYTAGHRWTDAHAAHTLRNGGGINDYVIEL